MVNQKGSSVKLPNQLSIEELEALVSGGDSVVAEDNDPFLLFLSTFNITPGKYRVHTSVLYRLYNAWAAEPIKPNAFGIKMSKFFPNDSTFYRLSSSSRKMLATLTTFTKKNKWENINLEERKKKVEEWINVYSIREGKIWVSSHILYYLYKRHRDTKQKPGAMSLRVFSNLMKLYFPYKHTHNYGLSFQIDNSVRNALTAKELAQLREGWERTSAKKKKSSK